MNLLPIMILVPAIAMLLIALLKERHSRLISCASTLIVLAISIALLGLSIANGNVSF
ncbi:MAG: hypothetical protein KGH66_00185 [Candidatus Micrarchaeota archaeon]|nr:hypothetical protein [Candidatus Micrarchaeota archaeon]